MRASKAMVRALLPVIRMLDREEYTEAREALCRITRMAPPATTSPLMMIPGVAKAIVYNEWGVTPVTPSRQPQPKPPKRIKNQRAMTAYKKKVGQCETRGPDCWGPLDLSHIKKKSAGGPDVDEKGNVQGLVQCRYHHELYERSPRGWWVKYGPRLTPEGRAKVLRWRPEIESKGRA